ncbi:MAG TPA: hypothetical protein VIM30_01725 [Candidatus Limnocylindrales bacterium]|jgi:hypothetical protein
MGSTVGWGCLFLLFVLLIGLIFGSAAGTVIGLIAFAFVGYLALMFISGFSQGRQTRGEMTARGIRGLATGRVVSRSIDDRDAGAGEITTFGLGDVMTGGDFATVMLGVSPESAWLIDGTVFVRLQRPLAVEAGVPYFQHQPGSVTWGNVRIVFGHGSWVDLNLLGPAGLAYDERSAAFPTVSAAIKAALEAPPESPEVASTAVKT